MRPGAKIIGVENSDKNLMVSAAQNPDGSIAIVLFNEGITAKNFTLSHEEKTIEITISGQAIQTIMIPTKIQ